MTIFIYRIIFHMTMEESLLIRLGFNRNEAKVYIALLRKGSASAGELIKATEFHRNIVYDNLEKLINKGLVSYILESKRKIFQANPSEAISQMLEKEQESLDEKKRISDAVKKEVSKLISMKEENQEATIYRGIKGLKVLFKDTLEENDDYYVFGAPKSSLEMMGSAFWANYNLKREEKKIVIKMIFNEELRDWSRLIKSKITRVRFLPKRFDSLTETVIYGDKVAMIIWTEKPLATLIRDKNLAAAYKQYFDILWAQAKE